MLKIGDPYLACEIGNTKVKWKVYTFKEGEKEGGSFPVGAPLPERFKEKALTLPLYTASVNPPGLTELEKKLPVKFIKVGKDIAVPIKNMTKKPEQVGVDRLLGALAAYRKFGPSVVVDLGTAVTVNLVEEGPAFVGGLILPGPDLWAKSLNEHTAQLPLVRLRSVPSHYIGRDTYEAISCGIAWGMVGALTFILEKLEEERGKLQLCLTGGAAQAFSTYLCHPHKVVPDLVLLGIKEVVESEEKSD